MKSIKDLNLGFSDAQNYMQRANKQMFSDIFVKNDYLEDLLNSNVYFLIGEKGTGKTAYATFLNNSEYKGNKTVLRFINGTDYEKFYQLKKTGKIDMSGYVDVWKTILLLLLSQFITESDKMITPFSKNTLPELSKAIDEYYNKAFSPEIINALKITDKSALAAKLFCRYAEAGEEISNTAEFTEQRMQMNLYYICQKLIDALKETKLRKNITLCIDGIDIRPSQIPYNDYLECIRGLANACWILNTEIFSNIKDTKGQLRVVLLLRPDIYNSLDLQNSANKIMDNSVFLEWRTTYVAYKSSFLYTMANSLLGYDQPEYKGKEIWEKYFDWKIPSTTERRKYDTAFMECLKISLSRPRDIQYILKILQSLMKRNNMGSRETFDYGVYKSDEFQNQYSEYFLSSLKDQLSFYYSEEDFKHFKKFFDFFTEPQFTFEDYLDSYEKYIEYILNNADELPEFVDDPKKFLQLLYDCNIVAAIEKNGQYFHFSYREKDATNVAPEVLYGPEYSYRFHYGLYKKNNMGRF